MAFRASEHKTPSDSQVLIALTGSPLGIKQELEQILRNIETYGKPMQGIISSSECVREVITPVWNKTDY